MDINNGASGPGVAFVDGIAVPVNLKRAIEVRPGFDGAFTVVLDLPAPENRLPLFIRGLQFQPHIESVDRAAGEKVPDLACAYNDVHARVIAAAHGRISAIDG